MIEVVHNKHITPTGANQAALAITFTTVCNLPRVQLLI